MYNINYYENDSQAQLKTGYMTKVFGWMFVALLITTITAFGVAMSPTAVEAIFGNEIAFYGLLIEELIFVMIFTATYRKLSPAAAIVGLVFYAFLNGLTFSVIFLVYTFASILMVFLIAAAMFGGMAVYGVITKHDLTTIGSYLIMGLIGLIVAGILNLFFASTVADIVISIIGVIVFLGLTAYDTQKILKRGAMVTGSSQETQYAVIDTLGLYLDFINLILYLLKLLGKKK